MRLNYTLLALGTTVAFYGTMGAATPAARCDGALAAPVTELFPWPTPSTEMIEALHRLANADTTDPDLRRSLTHALNEIRPNSIVRAIFAPASVTEVRAVFAGSAHSVPSALRRDEDRRREALAHAIFGLRDRALQVRWMDFLNRDPVIPVRLAAARAFLTWPDEGDRDRFVLAPDLDQAERKMRMLAARPNLDRLSPIARWRTLQTLVPFYEKPDPWFTAALESFGRNRLLMAWYRDQIRGRILECVLADYDAGFVPEQSRRYRAHELGQLLNNLGDPARRARELVELGRRAAGSGAVARLAKETLAWRDLWESLYRHQLARTRGDYGIEAQTIDELRRGTFALGREALGLALRMKADLESRPYVPPDEYTADQIEDFEASLSPGA